VRLFNICNTLFPLSEIANIYRLLTKNKPIIDNIEIGINEEEFQNFFLRISIKAIKKLAKIAEKLAKIKVDKIENTEDF